MINLLSRAGKFVGHFLTFWHFKRVMIFLVVDVIMLSFVRRRKSDIILVIRIDLLGDYVIGRKFLRMVRNYEPYRDKKIVMCANLHLKELIETYDTDVFDDYIWVNRAGLLNEFRYRFKILRQIKQLGARVAIHPMRDPYLGDCLMRATCASERIGIESRLNPYAAPNEPGRVHTNLGDYFYTRMVPEDPGVTFEFDRNRRFFSAILPGVPLPDNMRLAPIPAPVPEIDGSFAIFMPGASDAFREWPPDRFAQVARHLFEARKLRILVLGTRADSPKALAIQRAAPAVAVEDLCGQLTLPQVVQLMSQCVVGVTNDSGGIHLLAALNKPGVAVSNCFSFGFFHPYPRELSDSVSFVYPPAFYALPLSMQQRKVVYGWGNKRFSIEEIPAKSVIERIEEILQHRPFHDPVKEWSR
ncbi:MAG: hypothetical protein LV480_14035 [Methylacidiphilales bacterium]|nr:hypothetical protein [Candidatus Methylacidiphilales bacterium]